MNILLIDEHKDLIGIIYMILGTRRFGVPIWEGLVRDVADRAELGLDVSNI